MIKKFLKRFEKLENTPADNFIKKNLLTSKRFECLEIGDKKIEVSITANVTRQEIVPSEITPKITYFLFCPNCSHENNVDSLTCSSCNHSLREDTHEPVQRLKKCICGTVNQKDRRTCWVCGRDFSVWGDKAAQRKSDNVIELNIDGKIYKSTDSWLPPEILALMERIRREGYSAKLVDEWLKGRNQVVEEKQQATVSRLSAIRYGLTWRIIAVVVLVLLSILQLRGCYNQSY